DLERVHQREGDAVLELRGDGTVDRLPAIAEDDGADRHGEVEVAVAVDVPHPRAAAALEVLGRDAEDVLPRPLGEGLRGRGDEPARALEQAIRFGDDGELHRASFTRSAM